MANVPLIRVFISSPGDVFEEHEAAKRIIGALPDRPVFRDRVAFRIVSWTTTSSSTPMLSHLSPQEAMGEGVPKPSECDIVVVILWSRMGTPFQDQFGRSFQSGTHWEVLDAMESKHPLTAIYACSRPVMFSADDDEGRDQFRRLKEFTKSALFNSGKRFAGINYYESLQNFREQFGTHFESLVLHRLANLESITNPLMHDWTEQDISTVHSNIWPQSPFPGLRAFTSEDAPIYFGREYTTDLLLEHLATRRFVAVVGNSGSGKSSLISAGLIPRLAANEIHDTETGSKDWFVARFLPGKDPFESLAGAVMRTLPALHSADPIDFVDRTRRLADYLRSDPSYLAPTIDHALSNEVPWSEIVFFIDQFEELFSMQTRDVVQAFVKCLLDAGTRCRTLLTLRADFYAIALEYLTDALRTGTFTVSPPSPVALHQMIVRPAERAALEFEPGLPEQLVEDTGSEPGALPLLAYALDALYTCCRREARSVITFADYKEIGGVQGAIARRADAVLDTLPFDNDQRADLVQRVFTQLVAVDERGTAVRRRAPIARFATESDAIALIDRLVEARLVVRSAADDGTPLVEVAHEALFRSWGVLARCIEQEQEDLVLLRQVTNAAAAWERRDRNPAFLWTHELLTLVYEMLRRLDGPELAPEVRAFIRREQDRLLDDVASRSTDDRRRCSIGQRLAFIGDDRPGVGCRGDLPDIDWVVIPAGNHRFLDRCVWVPTFAIGRYPVTHAQFEAFLKGDRRHVWWEGLGASPDGVLPQQTVFGNHPRDSVRWADAVAFTRWLDVTHRERALTVAKGTIRSEVWEIRLPTEWEWERAGTIPDSVDLPTYAWGNSFEPGRANTRESGLSQTTAVGMYPAGASGYGVFDLSGTICEWCLNLQESPYVLGGTESDHHVRRGGSCNHGRERAELSHRFAESSDYRFSHDMGFRVVAGPPPDSAGEP
jgi:Sulfatase-modifying factor enzyme 1